MTSFVPHLIAALRTSRSISRNLYGELALVEDNIAVDVCYGDLCGGNKVEVISRSVIHLTLLIGQLTCTET